VDDRPGIAGVAHLLVDVAAAIQQRAAGDLEVLDLVAMADDVRGVDIEARREHRDLGLQYAILRHKGSSVGCGSVRDTGAVRLPARGLRSAAGRPPPVRRAWLPVERAAGASLPGAGVARRPAGRRAAWRRRRVR